MELKAIAIHGHELAYRAAGAGPVLLVNHGMAGSATIWKHVTPTLASAFGWWRRACPATAAVAARAVTFL